MVAVRKVRGRDSIMKCVKVKLVLTQLENSVLGGYHLSSIFSLKISYRCKKCTYMKISVFLSANPEMDF